MLEHTDEREATLYYVTWGGTLLADDDGVLGDAIRHPSPYLLNVEEAGRVRELVDAGLAHRDESVGFPLTEDGRRWFHVVATDAGRALYDQWSPPRDEDEDSRAALEEAIAAAAAELGRRADDPIVAGAARCAWHAAIAHVTST